MEELTKKTRGYIRKAHEKFEIGLIPKEKLLLEGYAVYEAAFEHYKIHTDKQSEDDFKKRLEHSGDGYDYWGCVDKDTGKLEAYSICRRYKKCCVYESSKANPAFLPKYYPMYGMYYERNKYYLSECGFSYVVSSARSITEHSNIQQFLIEKFGFRKAYCHLQIEYVWWLKLLVNLLYPFRGWMFVRKIKSILLLEAMSRNEY